MKKVLSVIYETIFSFLLAFFLGIITSVKYIFTGASIVWRLVLLMIYGATISCLFFLPIISLILFGTYTVLTFILSIYSLKFSNTASDETSDETSRTAGGETSGKTSGRTSDKTGGENGNRYEWKSSQNSYASFSKIPFFDGMTAESAKKEYHKLMKKYHPDNAGGSVEMTQKIVAAYDKYCAVYGK